MNRFNWLSGLALALAITLSPSGAAWCQATGARAIALSHSQWQAGDMAKAKATIADALRGGVTADLAQAQAELLEADSQPEQAKEWYGKALRLTGDTDRKSALQLRLTLLESNQKNIQALAELAGRDGPGSKRQWAVLMSILGHESEAVGLLGKTPSALLGYRQRVQLSQWAINTGQAKVAQENSWKAVELAATKGDRKYAISLLDEAYELDRSQAQLLDRLSAKPWLSEDEQLLRTGLLRRLGRFDEAIVSFKDTREGTASAESRRQLLRLYADAGREDEMVAEYRRLIRAEPGELIWPEGLSQYLLEKHELAAVREVWNELIVSTTDPAKLLAAARIMGRFGLFDLASAAADKSIRINPAYRTDARMFQFEMYRAKGDSDEAGSALDDLDKALTADDKRRIELAYSFERIKQPKRAISVLEALDVRLPGGLGDDEKIRLAWLYDSSGLRDKALTLWKAMWDQAASASSRRIIEDRILALSAETGSLGDLVVDLESRLASGKASWKDVTLLIRIYTEAEDSAAAVETILEYFGRKPTSRTEQIASLAEQARVYRAIGQGKAFENVYRQLLVLDPDNRTDYLQSLILNRVESAVAAENDPQGNELRKWLDELRKSNPAGSAEFEAGVLVLAKMNDQAIETYRRALVDNPDHTDNYLLLADLLKKADRTEEAIAGLQYLVEYAVNDDGFMVGIDGILNMQPRDPEIIYWAQRRVLERLSVRGDKLYLYDLFAELAQEARDTEQYFRAMENSLPYAGERRSVLLRELMGAAGTTEVPENSQGELSRSVRYSRRLIALADELPPDVYLQTGRALLQSGDAVGAERAFGLVAEQDGESAAADIGDMFAAEGFSREAAAQYERALISDTGNLSTLAKLAEAIQGQGRLEDAHAQYLKAALMLLKAQPPKADSPAGSDVASLIATTTGSYFSQYRPLLASVIATRPIDTQSSFQEAEQAFESALSDAVADGGRTDLSVAHFPRLNATSRFARSLGLRTGNYVLVDRIEQKLLDTFQNDSSLQASISGERRAWGLSRSSSDADGPARNAEGSYSQRIARAMMRADQSQLLPLYQQWFLAMAPPSVIDEGSRGLIRSTPEIVLEARARLDGNQYRQFVRFVSDAIQAHPEYARDLLYSNFNWQSGSSILLDMEKIIGRQLLSESQVRGIIASSGLPQTQMDAMYLASRMSQDQQLEALQRQLKVDQRGLVNWNNVVVTLRATLSRPLGSADAARLDTVFKEGLGRTIVEKPANAGAALAALSQARLGDGIGSANFTLLASWDDYLVKTFPGQAYPGILKANALIDQGREHDALPLVLERALSLYKGDAAGLGRNAMEDYLREQAAWIYPKNSEAVIALAAGIDRREGSSEASAALQQVLRSLDPRAGAATLQASIRQKQPRVQKPVESSSQDHVAHAESLSPAPMCPLPSSDSTEMAEEQRERLLRLSDNRTLKRAIENLLSVGNGGQVEDAVIALRELTRRSLIWDRSLPPSAEFSMGEHWVQFEFPWLFGMKLGDATVVEHLAENGLPARELEAILNMVDPASMDIHWPLYVALAKAHVREQTLLQDVSERAQRIKEGASGVKELVLWIEELGRLAPEQAKEYLPLAEHKLEGASIESAYPHMLFGRLHASTGNYRQAYTDYQNAVLSLFSDKTVSTRSITVLEIAADARAHLDSGTRQEFFSSILKFYRPDGSPSRHRTYAKFVLSLLDIDPDSGVAQTALRSLIDEGSTFQREDVVRAARNLSRQGERTAALSLLKGMFERDLTGLENGVTNTAEVGSGGYADMLGVRSLSFGPASDRELLKPLFDTQDVPFQGEQAWLDELISSLQEWVVDGSIKRSTGVTAISLAKGRIALITHSESPCKSHPIKSSNNNLQEAPNES
ncbi:hypothetical protein [Pseudoxanthomonas putridarboris]|uniref:Tetratricopeptide repeat-containing protein n=1 Tax=Pseudoxanthomonas putridarboris TaxID=752605 RepID=A0ABU9IVN5_9GAMM